MGTNIVIPDAVLKKLNNLPREIRIKFWEQLERLLRNPAYPGLRNEKLHGTKSMGVHDYHALQSSIHADKHGHCHYSRWNP